MTRSTALLGLLAILTTSCQASSGPLAGFDIATGTNVVRYEDGRRVPSVAGPALDDGEISNALIKNKVTVINFWGSWCGPCREEQPILEQAWKDLAPDGVVFLGVNTRRDQKAAALAFIEEFQVTYRSVYDPDSSIAYEFGVRVMPATFVVAADGRVHAQIIGAVQGSEQLHNLIAEAT